jgi:hypothetical protein
VTYRDKKQEEWRESGRRDGEGGRRMDRSDRNETKTEGNERERGSCWATMLGITGQGWAATQSYIRTIAAAHRQVGGRVIQT